MRSTILSIALFGVLTASAQGSANASLSTDDNRVTSVGVDDYRRAYSMQKRYTGKVRNLVSVMNWSDTNTFTFKVDDKFKRGHIKDGQLTVCDTVVEPNRMQHEWEPGQKPKRQRHWMEVDDEKDGRAVKSPDGNLWAYIKNHNVYVCDKELKNDRQLTNDGTLAAYYSTWIQWSPDGRYVAVNRVMPPAEKRYVYYVESSPKTQLQPILHKQEYAKPGDELTQHIPTVINVATGKMVKAELPNQYDLGRLRWDEDSKSVTFEYNQRGHKLYQLIAMDAATGKLTTITEECAETFVNYSRLWRYDMQGNKEVLWTSERDGWNHLYLIDRVKNKTTQVTKGEWVIRRIYRVNEETRDVIFAASGIEPGDPYFTHFYKVNLDTKKISHLTPAEGEHNANFNSDYTMLVDTWSTASQPPITVLRSVANPNQPIDTLGIGDATALYAEGWRAPEVFAAPGRDGKTMMWGLIQRPSNFDPDKKYPVIEYIYSGPGDAYVPKYFIPHNFYMTSLCELGFIVVQLDAMGTSYRGKAFEEVCYKNLKDAGFPDRIAWIKHAAEQYPQLDTTRVGIYGCSAGGQESTTAVLWHPEFYKAAYSACGCHDNRMDKIWWNEQWMGYPVDSSYVECSNVEQAWRLTRPLMLVVGELDDNVDPASTMQVANALIKANKDFELVVIPGGKHTVGEAFGEHKRFDFFVKNLIGVNPPKWDELQSSHDK